MREILMGERARHSRTRARRAGARLGAAAVALAAALTSTGCQREPGREPACAPGAACDAPGGASGGDQGVSSSAPPPAPPPSVDSAVRRDLPPAPRESLLVGGTRARSSSGARTTAARRRAADSATAAARTSPEVSAGEPKRRPCSVERVTDGDTIRCRGGLSVRLLLIDAPELDQRPFGDRARRQLAALVPPGTHATLETDAQVRDRYGRLLAYVYGPDGRMANEEMVRAGYAVVLFYAPNRRYLDRMEAAAASAAAARRGLHGEGGFECAPSEHRRGRC